MAISKKDSTAKNSSSSPTSLHPPYFQMISEAITTIKDRTGSSQPAIAKFMEENYAKLLPPTFRKTLSIQLKRFVKSEKLVKIKNSYKIPAAEKVKKSSTSSTTKIEAAVKITDKKIKVAKKTVEKTKTKRLSQVKTPEGFRKVKTTSKKGSADGGKIKNKALTPVKRKRGPNSVKAGLRSPAKKAKK